MKSSRTKRLFGKAKEKAHLVTSSFRASSPMVPADSSSRPSEEANTSKPQPDVNLSVPNEVPATTFNDLQPVREVSECLGPTTTHALPVASSALTAIIPSSKPPGEPTTYLPLPIVIDITSNETSPASSSHVQSTPEEMPCFEPAPGHLLVIPSGDSIVASSTLVSPSTKAPENQAFNDAIERITNKLDPSAKEAFKNSHERITPEKTLETIRELDHSDATSGVRTGSKALGPAIGVLDTVMRSISISIQQSPEISSLVVGGIRLVIDLVAKFVQFYNKLSQMICQMVDYLKVFDQYSKLSRDTIVHQALVDIYEDLLTFCVESRRVFVDQQGAVKKFGHFRRFLRVQWQPFEEKFGEIKSGFAHHLDVLINSAQALQLGTLNDQFTAIRSGFNASETERIRIQSNEQVSERRQFLEWVSDINYEEIFNEIIKKRHPGTGEWLLEHKVFRTWVESPAASLLWCHGKPGAGKSVLSSLVLDHVSNFELNDPKTCVIFAYYSYQTPERHPLVKLLGSFIRQLTSKFKEVPQDTLKFFQSYYRDAKTPNAEDLNIHFLECLRQFPCQVIVVFDGLDECEPSSREEVFEFVARLVNNQSTLVKIFVTSRREEDIKDVFDGCPVVEIDSQLVNDDIRVFLQDDIERRIGNKSLKLRNQDLKKKILDALSSEANGMFLWAKLQLDWICKQRGDSDILGELESIPPDLYGTYDRILQCIEQRPPKQQELARQALMWVFYAKRPLKPQELVHALAIQKGMTQIEELDHLAYDEENILSCCGGLLLVLVTGEYDGEHIQPIHYSVFEYFSSATSNLQQDLRVKYFTTASQAHSEIASSCIEYMQLDGIRDGPCTNDNDFWERTDALHLVCYSSNYFDKHIEHIESISPKLSRMIGSLLNCETEHIAAILQSRRCQGNSDRTYANFNAFASPVDATTLMISTTLYDRPEFKHLQLEWTKESLSKYSLHQAALSGSEGAVARLLDSGLVDVNEKDDDGRTPLMHASQSGNSSIIHRLIIDEKADVNIKTGGPNYYTALSAASRYGHSSIVRMLIENGALIHESAVYWACRYNCEDNTILALLLAKGASATSSALQTAAGMGFMNRCILLLDHGAFVTVRALQWAFMRQGRQSAIANFLEEHSTPEIISEAEVLWSCGGCCEDDSVLEKLLANGAVATSEALGVAIIWKSITRCIILLDHGALVTAEALSQGWRWSGPDSDLAKLLVKHSTLELLAQAETL